MPGFPPWPCVAAACCCYCVPSSMQHRCSISTDQDTIAAPSPRHTAALDASTSVILLLQVFIFFRPAR